MRFVLPQNAAPPVGREPDLLDALMAIDNELVAWLIHARADNDDEREHLAKVLELRVRLEQDVNQLVLEHLRLSTAGIEPYIARLNAVSAQISTTVTAINAAKDVLKAAEEVVTISSQIVASLIVSTGV